jgi:hypothetical protein
MNFRPTAPGIFSADVVISHAAAIGIVGGDVVKLVGRMWGFRMVPAVANGAMLQRWLPSRIVARVRRAPTSPVVIVRIWTRIVLGSLFAHDEPV